MYWPQFFQLLFNAKYVSNVFSPKLEKHSEIEKQKLKKNIC